jgi:hypothetical protein
MHSDRSRFRCPAVALLLAGLAACSDGDSTDTTVDDATALQQALGAVEVADAMLTNTDEIAAGELGEIGVAWIRRLGLPVERRSVDPVWNPGEERWEIHVGYETEHGELTYVFTIQYTNADESHPTSPSAKTTLAVYGLVADMNSRTYQHGDAVTSNLHYDCAMDITALGASSHTVVGNGLTTGSLEGEKDGRVIAYDLDMAWNVDAAVPRDGGCGPGTMAVSIEPYALEATYDPSGGSYGWVFTQGETVLSSGRGTAACGKVSPVLDEQPQDPDDR